MIEEKRSNELRITSIQHFCVGDGPGIRTTVFLAGCNMRCLWCHNPEAVIEDIFKYSVLNISESELFEEICEDKMFFENSGGGVTFSGGEPVMQAIQLKRILKKCKTESISTAIETAGNYALKILDSILDYIDLIIWDCKAVSREVHIKCTGVSNEQILENLKVISSKNKTLWVRILVVWNVNITEEEMNHMGKYLTRIMPERVELMPYHKMGISKYDQYNLEYRLRDIEPPTNEQLKLCCNILKQYDINATYE